MHPHIVEYLAEYNPPEGLLFPGRMGDKPLTKAMADLILKNAYKLWAMPNPYHHKIRALIL